MYTSRPLHFHIVCDGAARVYLETRLHLLTHPVHNISVRFYQLSYETMRDRISREGAINTGHSAGIRMLPSWPFSSQHAANQPTYLAGLMKLFLHELLPDDVEKAIYVDTDAFFLTDPALLWRSSLDGTMEFPYRCQAIQNTKHPSGTTRRAYARASCYSISENFARRG
jgi:lipopolysaccharide biosynthesis glycosyltransferase